MTSNVTEQKKRIMKDIVEELKKKGYARFNYGGYIFLPNGDIKRRESYHSSIERGQNPLIIKMPSSTMETTIYYGEKEIEYTFNMDTYLLTDALNVLKDRGLTDERPWGYWDAEHEFQDEAVARERDRIGAELLAERAIVFKYIKGVSQIPIPEKFEITPDQEKYFKRFDDWAIAAGNYPAVKALKDLMDKIKVGRSKFLDSKVEETLSDRLKELVKKDVTEVYQSFENEESKSLAK